MQTASIRSFSAWHITEPLCFCQQQLQKYYQQQLLGIAQPKEKTFSIHCVHIPFSCMHLFRQNVFWWAFLLNWRHLVRKYLTDSSLLSLLQEKILGISMVILCFFSKETILEILYFEWEWPCFCTFPLFIISYLSLCLVEPVRVIESGSMGLNVFARKIMWSS